MAQGRTFDPAMVARRSRLAYSGAAALTAGLSGQAKREPEPLHISTC